MTFEELIELHQCHLASRRLCASTLHNYRQIQTIFQHFCREHWQLIDPRELRSRHLAAYFAWIQEQGWSRLVKYGRQRALRTWTAWATFHGHLLLDPCKDFTMKHPPLLPRGAFSEAQVQKLMGTPGGSLPEQRDQALMEFLYGTGARVGEALMVDVDDLALGSQQLRIRHGKGGTQRLLPLGPRLSEVMRKYLEEIRPQFPGHDQAPLWLTTKATRCTNSSVNARLRLYCRELPFRMSAYDFRHAFATHLLARGAPLVAVQRLLGHEHLQMTTRYTHLVPVDLKRMLDAHHPRARRRKKKR